MDMSMSQEIVADINRMADDFKEFKFQKYGLTSRPKPYGWHDSHFPPEYRKACLKGEIYNPDIYTGIYVIMAGWYERISGRKAPPNFEVYREWKNYVRKSGNFKCRETKKKCSKDGVAKNGCPVRKVTENKKPENTCQAHTAIDEKEVIIRAIEIGTHTKREKRDVSKLLQVLEGHGISE